MNKTNEDPYSGGACILPDGGGGDKQEQQISYSMCYASRFGEEQGKRNTEWSEQKGSQWE